MEAVLSTPMCAYTGEPPEVTVAPDFPPAFAAPVVTLPVPPPSPPSELAVPLADPTAPLPETPDETNSRKRQLFYPSGDRPMRCTPTMCSPVLTRDDLSGPDAAQVGMALSSAELDNTPLAKQVAVVWASSQHRTETSCLRQLSRRATEAGLGLTRVGGRLLVTCPGMAQSTECFRVRLDAARYPAQIMGRAHFELCRSGAHARVRPLRRPALQSAAPVARSILTLESADDMELEWRVCRGVSEASYRGVVDGVHAPETPDGTPASEPRGLGHPFLWSTRPAGEQPDHTYEPPAPASGDPQCPNIDPLVPTLALRFVQRLSMCGYAGPVVSLGDMEPRHLDDKSFGYHLTDREGRWPMIPWISLGGGSHTVLVLVEARTSGESGVVLEFDELPQMSYVGVDWPVALAFLEHVAMSVRFRTVWEDMSWLPARVGEINTQWAGGPSMGLQLCLSEPGTWSEHAWWLGLLRRARGGVAHIKGDGNCLFTSLAVWDRLCNDSKWAKGKMLTVRSAVSPLASLIKEETLATMPRLRRRRAFGGPESANPVVHFSYLSPDGNHAPLAAAVALDVSLVVWQRWPRASEPMGVVVRAASGRPTVHLRRWSHLGSDGAEHGTHYDLLWGPCGTGGQRDWSPYPECPHSDLRRHERATSSLLHVSSEADSFYPRLQYDNRIWTDWFTKDLFDRTYGAAGVRPLDPPRVAPPGWRVAVPWDWAAGCILRMRDTFDGDSRVQVGEGNCLDSALFDDRELAAAVVLWVITDVVGARGRADGGVRPELLPTTPTTWEDAVELMPMADRIDWTAWAFDLVHLRETAWHAVGLALCRNHELYDGSTVAVNEFRVSTIFEVDFNHTPPQDLPQLQSPLGAFLQDEDSAVELVEGLGRLGVTLVGGAGALGEPIYVPAGGGASIPHIPGEGWLLVVALQHGAAEGTCRLVLDVKQEELPPFWSADYSIALSVGTIVHGSDPRLYILSTFGCIVVRYRTRNGPVEGTATQTYTPADFFPPPGQDGSPPCDGGECASCRPRQVSQDEAPLLPVGTGRRPALLDGVDAFFLRGQDGCLNDWCFPVPCRATSALLEYTCPFNCRSECRFSSSLPDIWCHMQTFHGVGCREHVELNRALAADASPPGRERPSMDPEWLLTRFTSTSDVLICPKCQQQVVGKPPSPVLVRLQLQEMVPDAIPCERCRQLGLEDMGDWSYVRLDEDEGALPLPSVLTLIARPLNPGVLEPEVPQFDVRVVLSGEYLRRMVFSLAMMRTNCYSQLRGHCEDCRGLSVHSNLQDVSRMLSLRPVHDEYRHHWWDANGGHVRLPLRLAVGAVRDNVLLLLQSLGLPLAVGSTVFDFVVGRVLFDRPLATQNSLLELLDTQCGPPPKPDAHPAMATGLPLHPETACPSVPLRWGTNLLVVRDAAASDDAEVTRWLSDWEPSCTEDWAHVVTTVHRNAGHVALGCERWLSDSRFSLAWCHDREVAVALCCWLDDNEGGTDALATSGLPDPSAPIEESVLLVLAKTCHRVSVDDDEAWRGAVPVGVRWSRISGHFSEPMAGGVTLYNYLQGYVVVPSEVRARCAAGRWDDAVSWSRLVATEDCYVVRPRETCITWSHRGGVQPDAIARYAGRILAARADGDDMAGTSGEGLTPSPSKHRGKKRLRHTNYRFYWVEWEHNPGHPRWESAETVEAASSAYGDVVSAAAADACSRAHWLGCSREDYGRSLHGFGSAGSEEAFWPFVATSCLRPADDGPCRRASTQVMPPPAGASGGAAESALGSPCVWSHWCVDLTHPPLVMEHARARNAYTSNLVRLLAMLPPSARDDSLQSVGVQAHTIRWARSGHLAHLHQPVDGGDMKALWRVVCDWHTTTDPYPPPRHDTPPISLQPDRPAADVGALVACRASGICAGSEELWDQARGGFVLLAIVDRSASGDMWCRSVRGAVRATRLDPLVPPNRAPTLTRTELMDPVFVWLKAREDNCSCEVAEDGVCPHSRCCFFCGLSAVDDTPCTILSRTVCRACSRHRKTSDGAVCMCCMDDPNPPVPMLHCKRCARGGHATCISRVPLVPIVGSRAWKQLATTCPNLACADRGALWPGANSLSCHACTQGISLQSPLSSECPFCRRKRCEACEDRGDASPVCDRCATHCTHNIPGGGCPACPAWWTNLAQKTTDAQATPLPT